MTIRVEGSAAETGVAREVIRRCTFPLERLGALTILFTHSLKGPALSMVSERLIAVAPQLPPRRLKYVIAHELGHFVDHDCLDEDGRHAIGRLMRPPAQSWTEGVYRMRPSEAFADAFVKVFSDIEGSGWYGRRIVGHLDVEEFRTLVLGGQGMNLYGVNDDLPAELADEVLEDNIPVGPPDDEDTATAEEDEE